MDKTRLAHVLALILVGGLALVGCDRIQVILEWPTREQAGPTPLARTAKTLTPMPTPKPADTATLQPTDTPEPTSTPTPIPLTPTPVRPTPTPISPTATFTPKPPPTWTPTATPPPASTWTPTATPLPPPTWTPTATPLPAPTWTPIPAPWHTPVYRIASRCSAQRFRGGFLHGGHAPYTYAFFNDGIWVRHKIEWIEGVDPRYPSCTDNPWLQYGFGKLYCLYPDIAERLGDPYDEGDTLDCTIEVYSNGVLLPARNYRITFWAQYGESANEGTWSIAR